MIVDYYTRDHLGSVREMCSSTGTIVARYSYDPYGKTTLVSGMNLAAFQYTGDYAHQSSTLNLAEYRAYDANANRWLSRDPIAEQGGVNLYGYVGNAPIAATDFLGLDPINTSGGGSTWGVGASAYFIVGGDIGVERVHLNDGICQYYAYIGPGVGLGAGAGISGGTVGNVGKPSDYGGLFLTSSASLGPLGVSNAVDPSAIPGVGKYFPTGSGATSQTLGGNGSPDPTPPSSLPPGVPGKIIGGDPFQKLLGKLPKGVNPKIKISISGSLRYYVPIGDPFCCK